MGLNSPKMNLKSRGWLFGPYLIDLERVTCQAFLASNNLAPIPKAVWSSQRTSRKGVASLRSCKGQLFQLIHLFNKATSF